MRVGERAAGGQAQRRQQVQRQAGVQPAQQRRLRGRRHARPQHRRQAGGQQRVAERVNRKARRPARRVGLARPRRRRCRARGRRRRHSCSAGGLQQRAERPARERVVPGLAAADRRARCAQHEVKCGAQAGLCAARRRGRRRYFYHLRLG